MYHNTHTHTHTPLILSGPGRQVCVCVCVYLCLNVCNNKPNHWDHCVMLYIRMCDCAGNEDRQ